MRKRLLLMTFPFLSFYTVFAQDSTYYNILWKPTGDYLKAKVREEKIYEYSIENDLVTDSFLLQVKVYDSMGRVVKQQDFFNNHLSKLLTNFYSNSQLDSSIEEQYYPLLTTTNEYAYDSMGNMLSVKTMTTGRPTVYQKYNFNSLRQPIQTFTRINDGKEFLSILYVYRSDNLVERIDNLDSAGRIWISYKYKYDKNKRITTRYADRHSNMPAYIDLVRTYNERQRLVKIEAPSRANILSTPENFRMERWDGEEVLLYNADGLLDERRISKNQKLIKIEKHVYL